MIDADSALPPRAKAVGGMTVETVAHKQKKSVAFFVILGPGDLSAATAESITPRSPLSSLPETIISASSPSFPSFPRHMPSRPAAYEHLLSLKLARAHHRRLLHLHDRKNAIARALSQAQYRILIHQHQEKIAGLRVRARIAYKDVVAAANREEQRMRRKLKSTRNLERAHIINEQALQKAVAMRRALSESFMNFLDGDLSSSGGKSLLTASSLDDLRWKADKDYCADERIVSGPPTSNGDSESEVSLSDRLLEVINAIGLSDLRNASSLGSPSDEEETLSKKLLDQFEMDYNSGNADPFRKSQIDDLMELIKSLAEDTHNILSSPSSAESSRKNDLEDGDILAPLLDSFSTYQKRSRTSISPTHLSDLITGIDSLNHAKSPVKRRSSQSMSPAARLLRRRDLLNESLSQIIERNKHFPVEVLIEFDESDYLELLPLLPAITRFTLRELDLDEILLNAQLRHDLYFDPNLQFKPNTEGDRAIEKRSKLVAYWKNVSEEIERNETFRIVLIIQEIKAILKELLPYSQSTFADIDANIDVPYISQQLEHRVFDASKFIKYLGQLLKLNCAPARDGNVDEMVRLCLDGKLADSLAACFETLEMMKLDYANHQLKEIRPNVVLNAIKFESNHFKEEIRTKRITMQHTEAWIVDTYDRLIQKRANQVPASATDDKTVPSSLNSPTLSQTYSSGLLHTVQTSIHLLAESETTDLLPEIFSMDVARLQGYRNDLQDITILACLLMLFRQTAGPRASSDDMAAVKKKLWILLNDSDTSLAHVVAEMVRCASSVRPTPMSDAEQRVLSSLVDKTLAPESKVFELVMGRITTIVSDFCVSLLDGVGTVAISNGTEQKSSNASQQDAASPDDDYIEGPSSSSKPNRRMQVSGNAFDKAKLAKFGLAELESEVRDLANHIGQFAKYNQAVHFDILSSFYTKAQLQHSRQ
ncbi:hypothetical protein HDU84_000097 [Entophlyctis sp. JEL0112]|nr:hypothetical protein HDU84_000097 [Entophlyctis sp. JEL0112]